MFLEEKIEHLKRRFPTTDFRVPFTDATGILKTIESKFIKVKDVQADPNNLRQRFSQWSSNVKNKVGVMSTGIADYGNWLDKLDSNANYWMVITTDESALAKHLVYDCKPTALAALASIAQTNFFIIDKKYEWFILFELDKLNQTATIYKGGNGITPFEN
jgi:hypothetical protein